MVGLPVELATGIWIASGSLGRDGHADLLEVETAFIAPIAIAGVVTGAPE